MPSQMADSSARARRFDVSTLGEALLRFSVRPGELLEDAPRFDVHVAGSECNVAYALARIGLHASWASVLPRDPLGQRVAVTLQSGGVDLSNVVWRDTGRLGTYFVELSSAPRPSRVTYDRAESVMCLATPDLFAWDSVCDAVVCHLSGITLGISKGAREVARTAIREARARGCRVSLDVNYRALLWTPDEASAVVKSLAGQLDLLICRREDADRLFGLEGGVDEVAGGLQELMQVNAVVVTQGAKPAFARLGSTHWECLSHQVQVVDRVGAGDAFAAGVIWGYLEGSLEAGLERGVAMAALKMTVHGDLFRLGRESVTALLERRDQDIMR